MFNDYVNKMQVKYVYVGFNQIWKIDVIKIYKTTLAPLYIGAPL